MAYRKGLVLSFGVLSCTVNLDGALSKEASLKTLCIGKGGKEHAPVPIKQKMQCGQCALDDPKVLGLVSASDLVKGKEVGDNQYAIVAAEEIKSAQDAALGTSKKLLGLTPHLATDVASKTLPVGSVYFLEPENSAQIGPYSILLDTAERLTHVTFTCQWSPVSKVGLWQLTAYDGVLALEGRTWPEEVKPRPSTGAVEVSEAHQAQMDMLLASLVQPFDPSTYRNVYRDTLADLVAKKDLLTGLEVEGATKAPRTAAGTPGAVDLSATLNAMLAAVAPAAAPVKRTRKKVSA